MTNLTNVTTLQGLAAYTNNYTNGVLFDGGMFVFFIILLMGLLKFNNDFEASIMISSWSMFVVSSLFWLAHLVSIIVIIGFLILAALSALYINFNRKR